MLRLYMKSNEYEEILDMTRDELIYQISELGNVLMEQQRKRT